jgi:hypothetical protein
MAAAERALNFETLFLTTRRGNETVIVLFLYGSSKVGSEALDGLGFILKSVSIVSTLIGTGGVLGLRWIMALPYNRSRQRDFAVST